MNIKELNITNAEIDTHSSNDIKLYINFCLNDEMNYYLSCHKKKDGWIPLTIYHDSDKKNSFEICDVCNGEMYIENTCEPLKNELMELYNLLVNHPKVRLKLLFI